jgi:hypothetical protein
MKLAWFVTGSALAVWAGAAVVSACGGSESSDVVGPAADAASSDGASSTSSSGSSGGASDGGSTSSSSGGQSTPNKVACGSSSCTTPDQKCCTTGMFVDGGVALDAGCIATADNCQGGSARCDDKTDCTNNEVCCGTFGSGGGAGTRCEATCGQGFQICKVTSECEDGGTCTEYTCFGNQKISLCKKPQQGCQ